MKNKYYILLSGIAVVLIALYFLVGILNSAPYQWRHTLYCDDDNPYGTKYLFETLKQSRDSLDFVVLKDSVSGELNVLDQESVYLFIGHNYYFDSCGADQLRAFVENGNEVFFSVQQPFFSGSSFYDVFDIFGEPKNLCIDSYVDTSINHKFCNDTSSLSYWFYYVRNGEFGEGVWYYFEECDPDSEPGFDSTFFVSTFNDGYCNMLKFQFGKGAVYFFTNPIMLSNHYLAEKEGLDFANATLAQFNGKKIYWDEASKYPPPEIEESDIVLPESILKYVFSQPGLKWAWYVLISGVLLFVIFRSKREQQIIPLMPENKNNSAEFVKSIALLYFYSGDHSKIVAEMMHQFLLFVKMKYGIKIKMNATEKYVADLANVTEINPKVFSRIFKLNIQLEVSNESANARLKELNNQLDYFYKNCK